MTDWLDHPAVQGGIAPLLVALVVAAVLSRTRFAWLAIVAGYATSVALATGFPFSPLTAGRKVVLLCLVAPLAGLALDLADANSRKWVAAVALAAGIASAWVFASLYAQREGLPLAIAVVGIGAFVAATTALMLSLRDDGLAAGAAGLGLGLATGVAAVLSASIGFLISGVAIAAAAGALLLVQVIASRNIAAGHVGTLSIGIACALFAAGTTLLAELKWWILPLLLLVPLAARLPLGAALRPFPRAALLAAATLAVAALPIAAAWFAARGSS